MLLRLLAFFACTGLGVQGAAPLSKEAVISVERVRDRAGHSAFTDLCAFGNRIYLAFREGSGHVPGRAGLDGTVRVLVSEDGWNWRSAALLEQRGVDLRDPKLSVTPEGRIMVLMGGSVYEDGRLLRRNARVSFSDGEGAAFSAPAPVVLDGAASTGRDWLWRVTWHGDRGYGVVYRTLETDWKLLLVTTEDGIHYTLRAELEVPGKANETTLRFLPDGRLAALVRREGGNKRGWVGTSPPPYTEWTWAELPARLGGPNFLVLPGGGWLAASRGGYDTGRYNTTLYRLDASGAFEPLLTLPSGGDTGYPGLLVRGDRLLVSYYASHEGRTAVYLAVLRLPVLAAAVRPAAKKPGGAVPLTGEGDHRTHR